MKKIKDILRLRVITNMSYAINLDLFSYIVCNYKYNIYIRQTKGFAMIVLSVIGIIVLSICIYLIIIKVNSISYKNYKYEFFNKHTLALFTTMLVLLFTGKSYYFEAASNNGDIWNGILLFAIGVIIFIIRLILNIKIAGFFKGLVYTIIQLIIFIPLSIIALLVLYGAMVVATRTRPVFRIN